MDKLQDIESVIEAVKARADIAPYARRVGVWVWVEFPDKPGEETRAFLKGVGFHWNKTRAAWQHNCGTFRRINRHCDPRTVYGEAYIQDQLTGA